jgi:uncharacterized protein YegJ (DUF2314 family)
MKRKNIFSACLIFVFAMFSMLVLISSCTKKQSNQGASDIISVRDDDIEMKAAIAKARATLPKFWKIFQHPANNEDGFAIKKEVVDRNGNEFFWFTDIQQINNKIFGKVNNEPEIVANVKLGQKVEIKEQEIVDWLYYKKEKLYGNYTLRALFKQMSPEEVKYYKEILAEP